MREQELTPKQRCFDESLAVFKDSLIELAEFYLHNKPLVTLKIAEEIMIRLESLGRIVPNDATMQDLINQFQKLDIELKIDSGKFSTKSSLDTDKIFVKAAKMGWLGHISFLWKRGYAPNPELLKQALFYAIEFGHDKIVDFLFHNLNARTFENNLVYVGMNTQFTPFSLACASGHIKIIQSMINKFESMSKKNPDLIKQIKNSLAIGLESACQNGDLPIVKMIIEFCKKIEFHILKKSVMPLHNAAEYGHEDVVVYLLENGADVSLNSFAALTAAKDNNHASIIKLLAGWLAKGSD